MTTADGPSEPRDDETAAEADERATAKVVSPNEMAQDKEMPMEQRKPSAVFGLVAGSYLVILIGALLVVACVLWWLW